VSRVDPLPDEVADASIKSAGIGLRVGYRKSVVLRLDLAQILKDTAIHDAGSQRLTGAIALIF